MNERKTPPGGATGAAAGTADRSMPQAQSGSAALPRQTLEIASGYAFTGPALDLGALLWDGVCLPDAQVRIPLPMLNRYGLVADATGTGKTKTLQLIAEQLSAGRTRPSSSRSSAAACSSRSRARWARRSDGRSPARSSVRPGGGGSPPPPEVQPRFSSRTGGCFSAFCGFGVLRAASARSRARRTAYGSVGMAVFLA
jgi:hypothetical protein